MEKTLEEIEAETAALQAQIDAARAKKGGNKKPQRDPAPKQPKDGDTLRAIQQDTRCKTLTGADRIRYQEELSAKYGGTVGPTLINKIEGNMDKRRKLLAQMIIDNGAPARISEEYILNKGRYEGFAATLAILRSSNLKHEIARSNERLGIEG